MNGRERVEAVLRGQWPDTVPIVLHNFLMAARQAGLTMRQYRESARNMANAHIQAVETYGYDGVVLDMDTALLAGAIGVPVAYPEDEPARAQAGLLPELHKVGELPPVDIACDERVQITLEAARIIHAHFGDEVYLRGNCDQCAFSLASMVRSPEAWLMDLMDPENAAHARELLAYCNEATVQMIGLMADTGAHMVSNGDSPAGPDMISPAMYRTWALPYEQRAARQAHAAGKPHMLHVCGNTAAVLDDLCQTGSDALELDYKTDPRLIHDHYKARVALSGNIDPSGVLAFGTPQLVAQRIRELLDVYRDSPRLILNAGCAIPAETPSENLRAMIEAARTFG